MADEQASAATAAPTPSYGDRGQQVGRGQRGGGFRRDNRRRDEQPVEEKQFDERVIHIDRVARVVKGGRRFRFRGLVVVGDRKGKVGIGLAKGADVTAAVAKATEVAKKHMVKVVLYKDTLPHEVEAKVAGARILLMPAAPGTGLIAGGVVRTVLEVAGVGNALSKSFGSSNKSNIAYATIDALQKLVPAKNWVTTAVKAASSAKTVTEPKVTKKVAAAKKPVAKKEEK